MKPPIFLPPAWWNYLRLPKGDIISCSAILAGNSSVGRDHGNIVLIAKKEGQQKDTVREREGSILLNIQGLQSNMNEEKSHRQIIKLEKQN